MLSLQLEDQSRLLVCGQWLYSLYYEKVFCLVLLPLPDDLTEARQHPVHIFGGFPVSDGAGYTDVMALLN